MQLVEKHNIKKSNSFYTEIDDLCFRSKNLYNSLLYIANNYYKDKEEYIGLNNMYHAVKATSIWNECNLPKKVCNQIVKQVDTNFRAFFAALKAYKKNPSIFISSPKPPKYKNSKKGKNIIHYPKDALYSLVFKKKGTIKLSDTNIEIKTKLKDYKDIRYVRLIPKNDSYTIEIVYEIQEPKLKLIDKYASIDLGVNNLATVGFSNCKNPFAINGKPLKSINQFYNKTKARLQSKLNEKQRNTNRITELTNKRNNKINDYMHKASRLLVNQLVSRDISKLVIGYNQNWKQDINIGKRNNQNFVNIPFNNFINMIEYKCKMKGIETIRTEESYTSKCSFIDNEPIKKHETYLGKRIKRGLFKTLNGKLVNADLNGSYNILRKVAPDFKEGVEDIAVYPSVLTVNR